jgi:hypothetical protein
MGMLQDEFTRVLADELRTPNLIKALLGRVLARRGLQLSEQQLIDAANKVAQAPDGAKEMSISLDIDLRTEMCRSERKIYARP